MPYGGGKAWRISAQSRLRSHRERASRAGGSAHRSWSFLISTPTLSRASSPALDPVPSFADLGVAPPLVARLTDAGITTPFPIQSATLPDSMAGRDVLGRGRTGSGKTLAFALPLVSRLTPGRGRGARPTGLVLVPTRELATQVSATLAPLAEASGLRLLTVFGGVPEGKQVRALRGGVDILVACPGRLADLAGRGLADLSGVEVTVLDEADHMADLGFLPVVRRLLDRTPAGGQRLLFSATLDGGVDVLVRRYLRDPVVHSVDESSVPAQTMTHHVLHVAADQRVSTVADLVHGSARSVVFTRTKRGAKTLARRLQARGLDVVELHGDLAQGARTRNLAAFTSGRARALVATDIAARGIHVDDVGLVVHADPPAEHKAYLHRSGRTARAGGSGTVVTLATGDQAGTVRDLMRRAGIRPSTGPLGEGAPAVLATSGAVAATSGGSAEAAALGTPAARPARTSRSRRRRPAPARRTDHPTSRPHSAAGFSAAARGR